MFNRKAVIAATLGLLVATPAVANSADQTVISIADLDLANAGDRQVMNDRVERAVKKFCRSGVMGLNGRNIELECTRAALAEVKPQADRAVAAATNNDLHQTKLALVSK